MKTVKKTKAIAARVTPHTARLLREIAASEELSRSEVIEQAVQMYATRGKALSAAQTIARLTENQFVGQVNTEDKLSIRYKEELTRSWGQKHGHR